MCGIAGIVVKAGKDSKAYHERFKQATLLMEHRGPDAAGNFVQDNIALYHYRLSIMDIDPRSNQPFVDDRSNALVYNGELYNYRELKKNYGIVQRTTSDTEVLMALVRDKGSASLREMNGIFAFAYFDSETKELLLARDRFGVKPLYYYDDDEFFLFSSEAKVIYKFLSELRLNFQVLTEFLYYGSSNSNETIISGVNKVGPGECFRFSATTGKLNRFSYWSLINDLPQRTQTLKEEEVINTVREKLELAIERQCMSDVPVGAYLSGGLDSSTIVALASKHISHRLNTYSVEFDFMPPGATELPEAREIANKFGTNHHEFRIETSHLEDSIDKIVFQYDEPFADPAALPLYLISKSCSGLSKVVLQGDGGDELFAGYGRHLDLSQYRQRKYMSSLLAVVHPSSVFRKRMRRKASILNQGILAVQLSELVTNGFKPDLAKIFRGDWENSIANTDPYRSYRLRADRYGSLDELQRMLYTDVEVILPNTFFEKVDKVNMLHSIEARVPFLDNDLVDYVMTLPSSMKIRNGTTKWLLREAMKDVLPTSILKGRKKSFGTPMGPWLRSSLHSFAESLLRDALNKYPFIDISYLLLLLNEHREGKEDHATLLWRSLVLITWLNLYSNKIRSEDF